MKNGKPWLFGIHADPPRFFKYALALIPFCFLLIIYFTASDIRLQKNPHDKLLPSITKIGKAVKKVAFSVDKRSGKVILFSDTWASLKRLFIGITLSALIGFGIGLNMGLLPGFRGVSLSFITFVSNVPPLAILPILFISFGVGELGKIMLIFIGTFPLITRDIYLSVKRIPREAIVKALTLGASQKGVVYRVVLPQILPRLLETIRLSLGAGWLFLIASEAIASQNGLGYRIFLVRRYMSMDVIIIYVAWITLLAFCADFLLKKVIQKKYPWYSLQ